MNRLLFSCIFLYSFLNLNAFELEKKENIIEEYKIDKYLYLDNIDFHKYFNYEIGMKIKRNSFYTEVEYDNKLFEIPYLLYKNDYRYMDAYDTYIEIDIYNLFATDKDIP